MNSETRIVLRQMARLAVCYAGNHISAKRRSRILARLVRSGHVTMGRYQRSDSTSRNTYTLTSKGLKAAYMLDRRSKRHAEPWAHERGHVGIPNWKARQAELDRV